jgi:peptidyl-tRNA hydrolase
VGRLFLTEYLLKCYSHSATKQNKYYEYKLNAHPLLICLSETYMNLSGQAVTGFLRRNSQINKKDLIVVHDDLEHKFGNVRIKEGGSAQYISN